MQAQKLGSLFEALIKHGPTPTVDSMNNLHATPTSCIRLEIPLSAWRPTSFDRACHGATAPRSPNHGHRKPSTPPWSTPLASPQSCSHRRQWQAPRKQIPTRSTHRSDQQPTAAPVPAQRISVSSDPQGGLRRSWFGQPCPGPPAQAAIAAIAPTDAADGLISSQQCRRLDVQTICPQQINEATGAPSPPNWVQIDSTPQSGYSSLNH